MTRRALGRVLVTGAGGFLGAALVTQLRQTGHKVTATDLGATPPCDVTDLAQVEAVISRGCDTIFHCGAVSGPMVMADRPLDVWRINAGGTAHILEAARRHTSARVVVCSTTEIYGSRTGVVDELTPPWPASVYGASKLAAEAAVLGYVHEGVDAVALRLSWIYGPGRRTPTLLETTLRALVMGEDAAISAHAEDPTHYLWVGDAVAGLIRAAEASALPHRIYNITAGAALPMREVTRAMMSNIPDATVTLNGTAPSRHPSAIDASRALQDLGFQAATPFSDGIAYYVRWLAG